ncbi:MAG: hypothetical protein IPH85_12950 [Ignavibacteria bacterium]|nr:hypothetical protein [Ignavibacteria bacterium]MBP7093051.1 hypothetical protein [Candidatus Kapabacteria bacterium]MBK6418837.1 hypothetical protein [Ignavibacteria bacterium]MBK6760474.1 hypothetical protein [Ignavibacteria bacterium]MBK7033771.1 hypothetical protein [Ignavibacteria bacterium]
MAVLTVRNLPDEVHRALRLLAAEHGRSTEAEVRAILAMAVDTPDRMKLGSLVERMRIEAGLTAADVEALERSIDQNRDQLPHEPMDFE